MNSIFNFSPKTESFQNDKYLAYFLSENNGEIKKLINTNNIEAIKNIRNDFFVVINDKTNNKISIIADKYGRERLFYYLDGSKIILSDIFWNIIEKLKPEEINLNHQNFLESTVFGRPINHETIIDRLFILEPSEEMTVDLNNGNIKKNTYWDFKYKRERNLDEMIENYDNLLNKSAKAIINKHGVDTRYGIGLSCGMDSRLVVEYMLKNGAKNIRPFIIGEKRPNKILLSREHKTFKKLLKYFNLKKGLEVEYDNQNFSQKFFNDIKHYPIGPSQAMININNFDQYFDCFLSGIPGGELVGQFFKKIDNIETLDQQELADKISHIYYLRDTHIINFFPQSAIKKMHQKLENFVNSNNKKDNIDILQKFLFLKLLSRGKYNFFGNFYNKKPAELLFWNYDILDEVILWDPKYFVGNKFQKEFFIKKHKKLAKIKEENPLPAIYFRKSQKIIKIKNLFNVLDTILRGPGLNLSKWIKTNKRYIKWTENIIINNKEDLETIFKKDIKAIINLRRKSPRVYDNIVKYIIIIFLIKKNINPLKINGLSKHL